VAGPNKGTAVNRRATAKGYHTNDAVEKKSGRKSSAKEKASNDWAAESRMFHDENKKRKLQSTQISNFESKPPSGRGR
jgi:hypothetical protein